MTQPVADRPQRRIHAILATLAPLLLTAVTAFVLTGTADAAPGAGPAAPVAQAARPAAAALGDGWLHTSGSAVVDASGAPVQIKAVNWFGLETSNCAPHGLWQIGLDAGMAQIASWGFNTVRLPWSNQCLAAPATGVDAVKNPTLQHRTGQQVMDAVVASARAHGLKVLLDRHRPETSAQSELWYTAAVPEQRWIADWVTLARRYAADPTVIGADLHNEPHGAACWGCGDPARDWAAAATRAGNAVLAANRNLLVLVEGVERSLDGRTTWWGGSLVDAATHPVRLSVPGRLVYSPHDYPASVYAQPWFSAADYPANLTGVWDRNWGYLQKTGTAPVLLGEFGTKLETTSDRQWLTALVRYLGTTGAGWAYWDYNPNSGDTGGLLADDWVTPQTAKLQALAPLLGRTVPTTPAPTPAPSNPAPSGPAPSNPAPSGRAASGPASSSPAPSGSTSSTGTSVPAPGPSGTPGAVTAAWTLQSSWNAGYVAQLVVRPARGSVGGWTVSWADPDATGVVNAWGMTCRVGGGRVSCTGADWARTIAAGASVTVGLQVADHGTGPARPELRVG
ncbi:cellulase family glycosylhydrolase [Nakamurella endophytica]|uniref:Endoglucanase n=1 Tax=Nakamurella endophytica TaxID=1748367 RepID=A0A917SUT1_9ACTN|nr:cellulase family glycosylhydrolase [Nakamurella endophytica]GGL99914.1 hypothetical protein GCM10011594_19900 [Nakamurella endophytica]